MGHVCRRGESETKDKQVSNKGKTRWPTSGESGESVRNAGDGCDASAERKQKGRPVTHSLQTTKSDRGISFCVGGTLLVLLITSHRGKGKGIEVIK